MWVLDIASFFLGVATAMIVIGIILLIKGE